MTLQEYAIWLKENHLGELVKRNMEIASEMQIAPEELYGPLPGNDLTQSLEQSLAEFLESLSEGSELELFRQNIQEWEEENLTYALHKRTTRPVDIMLANYAQCRALILFVPRFTPDSEEAAGIIYELSKYVANVQKLGFEMITRTWEKEEDRFRLIVSGIREYAIYSLDAKGYVTSWNEGAERMKGYRESEIIGRHFSVVYPREEVMAGKPEKELEIAAREGRFEAEGWCRRKDGSHFWANVVMRPIYNAEHNLLGYAKITQDLTERRKYERKLSQKNRELMRYLDDTEQFAHAAAHDLRQPIRVVSTFTRLLQEIYSDEPNPVTKKYRNYIVEAINRMYQLLDDLQEYTSIRRLNASPEIVDLNKIMETVKEQLSGEIADTHAEIFYSQLPQLSANAEHMKLLFQNLVENAIKFHKEHEAPRIEITAQNKNKGWYLAVSDNGIGIDKQHHKKIFGIFQRLHAKEAYPGTGMGLAICKKIAALYGGKISLESEPGKGSVFTITLPANLPPA
jgi:PAS domain S-box-containing protein